MNERTTNTNGSPDPQLIRHGEGLVHLATPIDPDCDCVGSDKKLRSESRTERIQENLSQLMAKVHKARRMDRVPDEKWTEIMMHIDAAKDDINHILAALINLGQKVVVGQGWKRPERCKSESPCANCLVRTM